MPFRIATGGTLPTLVRDRNGPRVFLGPLAMFQQQPAMELQAPFQLAGMPQGPQPAVPLALQAITPAAQPQVPGHAVARDAQPQLPAPVVHGQDAHGIAPVAHGQVARGIAPVAQVAHGNAAPAGVARAPSAPMVAGARRNRNIDRVRRPMNCWIMYRKHFHPIFVNANSGASNNQICKFSGSDHHPIKANT